MKLMVKVDMFALSEVESQHPSVKRTISESNLTYKADMFNPVHVFLSHISAYFLKDIQILFRFVKKPHKVSQ
jgi:hypothetical protein